MRVNTSTDRLFTPTLLLLTLLSIAILWSARFPPMQDYPTHLMIAKVLATAQSPEYDWSRYYTVDQGLGPYRLTYFLLQGLQRFLDIETAGKLLISLYFLLVSGFVYHQSRRRAARGATPWLLLLLPPLAFNQAYYFGFLNYLFSLPVLLWLLCDHIELAEQKRRLQRIDLQLIGPLLLFLLHPYTFLVYTVLGGASSLLVRLRQGKAGPAQLIPLLWFCAFLLWYLATGFGDTKGIESTPLYWYWPVEGNIYYLLLPFYGHQTTPLDGVWSYLGWLAVVLVLLKNRSITDSLHLRIYLALLLAGFFILPFGLSGYPYFNLRLAIPLYLILILYLSRRKIARRDLALLLPAILAMYVDVYQTHRGVSQEVNQVMPLFTRLPENVKLIPVYRDTDSAVLDRNIYYQMHAHIHDYYHALRGGGVSPGLFYNEMLPIRYRDDIGIPGIRQGTDNSTDLSKLSAFYDYALLRDESLGEVDPSWTLTGMSGPWRLYRIQQPSAKQ